MPLLFCFFATALVFSLLNLADFALLFRPALAVAPPVFTLSDFLPEATLVGLFFDETCREGFLPFLTVDFLSVVFIRVFSFEASFFEA